MAVDHVSETQEYWGQYWVHVDQATFRQVI